MENDHSRLTPAGYYNSISYRRHTPDEGCRAPNYAIIKLRQKLDAMSQDTKLCRSSALHRKFSIHVDKMRTKKVYPCEHRHQSFSNLHIGKLERLKELVKQSDANTISTSNALNLSLRTSYLLDSYDISPQIDFEETQKLHLEQHPLLQFRSPSWQLTKDYVAMAHQYKKFKPYRLRSVCLKCVICQTREATFVIFPCEHCCMCGSCCRIETSKIKSCPLCKDDIKKMIRRSGSENELYWQWVEKVSIAFRKRKFNTDSTSWMN